MKEQKINQRPPSIKRRFSLPLVQLNVFCQQSEKEENPPALPPAGTFNVKLTGDLIFSKNDLSSFDTRVWHLTGVVPSRTFVLML